MMMPHYFQFHPCSWRGILALSVAVLFSICLRGNVVCYASDNFYERLSRGVPSDDPSCFLLVSDVTFSRKSANQGFHRNVLSTVNADMKYSCDQCGFMILEHLPEGMYVDLYQFKMLEEFGAPAVLTLDDIDVEKPEHLSPNHTIAIYSSHMTSSISDHMTGHLTTSIDLPVHLRYHAPSYDPEVNHIAVYLPLPELFMHCIGCPSASCSNSSGLMIKAPCTADNQTICDWTPLTYTMESSEELEFLVPVGQEWHSIAVTVVILLAITLGMIALMIAMKMNKDMRRRKLR